MRIISQMGTFDVDYEDSMVYLQDNYDGRFIVCWSNNKDEYDYLGYYKTREDAINVIEEIRENYTLSKIFESLTIEQRNKMFNGDIQKMKDYIVKLTYYQVPKDE